MEISEIEKLVEMMKKNGVLKFKSKDLELCLSQEVLRAPEQEIDQDLLSYRPQMEQEERQEDKGGKAALPGLSFCRVRRDR